ncbi:outer membrane protein [Novosphingopyxis sp.]|uniref:outer membrane protein n=1 Tax=Novosphingopyxis sp. TaxID=2709690 RepID=UPI003B5B23BB
MRKFYLPLLAAGSAIAVPAMAQSAATDGPFTGPRVELTTGYDSLTAGSDVDSNNDNNDQSIDGLLYGAGVGYDFNVGGAVLGVEGEYTDSTAKVEIDNGDVENFGFGRVDAGRDLYVGVRAGVLVGPQTLIYAKGGYTNARLNLLARNGEDELRANYELDGFRIGAGAERAFTDKVFGKLEYRYSNYSSANFGADDTTFADDIRIDTDRHQVAVSLGYRF